MIPLLLSSSSTGNEKKEEEEFDDEEKNVIRSWDEFDASTHKMKNPTRGPPRIAIFATVVMLFISGIMLTSKKDAQRNYETVDKNTNAIFSSLEGPASSANNLSPFQTSSSESVVNDKSDEQRSEYMEITEEVVKGEENVTEEKEVEEVLEDEEKETEVDEEEVQVTKKEKKNAAVKEFGH